MQYKKCEWHFSAGTSGTQPQKRPRVILATPSPPRLAVREAQGLMPGRAWLSLVWIVSHDEVETSMEWRRRSEPSFWQLGAIEYSYHT